jgi:hypothetical protein
VNQLDLETWEAMEKDNTDLRAALQQAWDFAAGKQIPKASTLQRWSDLLIRTLNT